jgi:uncharacterized protein involved in response to NO
MPPRWETLRPLLRREPYRIFFPLGALLGAAGVGHWLLYVTGVQARYSGQGHAFVQVQAFLLAFACGFLLTMIPRRTGTASASWPGIAGLAAALVVVTAAALLEAWIVAEAAFLAAILGLVAFAGRRLGAGMGGPAPPDAFVLIPIGLAHGLVGAVLIVGARSLPVTWGMSAGRGMVQEGLFTCLVLGVGHVLLPALTGRQGSPEHRPHGRLRHALLGLAILASFPVQQLVAQRWGADAGVRLGHGLRAALVVLDMTTCVAAWRLPRAPGLHRRFAWIAFWMVPLGTALAALVPSHRVSMQHVTFIGGFSLLSFVVATHVIASHGGHVEVLSGRPWPVAAFGVLFLVAMSTRVTADLAPDAYWVHVGGAAGAWLLALAAWLAYLLPKVLSVPPPERVEGVRIEVEKGSDPFYSSVNCPNPPSTVTRIARRASSAEGCRCSAGTSASPGLT